MGVVPVCEGKEGEREEEQEGGREGERRREEGKKEEGGKEGIKEEMQIHRQQREGGWEMLIEATLTSALLNKSSISRQ